MKEDYEMYNRMMKVFNDNVISDDCYDVDMFCNDLCKNLFQETNPQDIKTDDFLVFQRALVLLIRDDMMLHYFGLAGLSVIHADMLDHGKQYYIYNEIFNS